MGIYRLLWSHCGTGHARIEKFRSLCLHWNFCEVTAVRWVIRISFHSSIHCASESTICLVKNIMHSTPEQFKNNKAHCGTGHVVRDILSQYTKWSFSCKKMKIYSRNGLTYKGRTSLRCFHEYIVRFYSHFTLVIFLYTDKKERLRKTSFSLTSCAHLHADITGARILVHHRSDFFLSVYRNVHLFSVHDNKNAYVNSMKR